MNRKEQIGVGYEFDYAKESKMAAQAWDDNINRRVSLYCVLLVAGKLAAARAYALAWNRANEFRTAHNKRVRPLE
jgi:hypothetical protein